MTGRTMSDELKIQFDSMNRDFWWLCQKYIEYKKVFLASEDQIGLLNKYAPRFFRIVQDALRYDIIMSICRITDSVETGKYQNQTIRNLPALVDPEYRQSIQDCVGKIGEKRENLEKFRNKVIAHTQKNDQGAIVDPQVRITEIEEAIESIKSVFQEINRIYLNTEVVYDVESGPGGGDALIEILDTYRDKERISEEIISRDSNPDLQRLINYFLDIH